MSLPVAARNGSLWPGVTLERVVRFSDEISRIVHRGLKGCFFRPAQTHGDRVALPTRAFSCTADLYHDSAVP